MKFNIFSLLAGCVCMLLLPFFNGVVCAKKVPSAPAAEKAAGAVSNTDEEIRPIEKQKGANKSSKEEIADGAKKTAKGLKKMFNGVKKVAIPLKVQIALGAVALAGVPVTMGLAAFCNNHGLGGLSTFFSGCSAVSWLAFGGCCVSGIRHLAK